MAKFCIQPVARRLEPFHSYELALVAIDGRGGSGKSTLALELAKEIGASIVHGDAFYRVMNEADRKALEPKEGYDQYIDWERLREEVLMPLRGKRLSRYQRYDWFRNVLNGWLEIVPHGIILVEGVYTFRPELREFYDFSIFVETPQTICLGRMKERGENPEHWIRRWAAAEDWYLENTLSTDNFDLVVYGGAWTETPIVLK